MSCIESCNYPLHKSLELLYCFQLFTGAGDILDAATFNPNRDLNIGSRIVTEHRRRYSKNIEGTITLAACHLVNCLCFEAYPTLGHLKWYSYTVSVSLNGSSWFELFKYSCFHCRGSQALHFPTISLRYSLVRHKHVFL